MTEWRPIETAPKDGTKIVIWNKRYAFCPIAAWHNSESDDEADGWSFDDWNSPCGSVADGFVGYNEDIEAGLMPTHWMPLPEPPRQNEDESDHPV